MTAKGTRLMRALGVRNSARYLVKTKLIDRVGAIQRFGRPRSGRGSLGARGLSAPIWFRYGTSDASVFWQVFVRRDYDQPYVGTPEVIVDCGANVGYASAYYASQFPTARVLAVEPDHGNCEMVAANLATFGSRIDVIEKAVWSRATPLRFVAPADGQRNEWAIQVHECEPGETADVQATTIARLIEDYRLPRIDILKIDIEGAELALFRDGPPAWLAVVRNLVMEYHGSDCRDAVVRATTASGFVTRELGHRMLLATR